MNLSKFEILFYALATGFVVAKLLMPKWVVKYYLWRRGRYRQGNRLKPLDCAKCMTGWFALALGLASGYGWFAFLLMIGGVFIGAIAEGLIMRWL